MQMVKRSVRVVKRDGWQVVRLCCGNSIQRGASCLCNGGANGNFKKKVKRK